MTLAGNSFAASHERRCGGRVPHRSRDGCPSAAVAACPDTVMLELPVVESSYTVVGAFNDMALHVFQSEGQGLVSPTELMPPS